MQKAFWPKAAPSASRAPRAAGTGNAVAVARHPPLLTPPLPCRMRARPRSPAFPCAGALLHSWLLTWRALTVHSLQADAWAVRMYTELAQGAVPPVLALDVEWCTPWFARPGLHKDKVAVLQLGSFGAGVLVFHVHRLPELPPTVARLLGDPDVALLGVNVAGDARRLMRSFAVRTKKGLRSLSPISHLPHTPPHPRPTCILP